MKLNKRLVRVAILAALCLGLLVLMWCWPTQPPVIIPLADGSAFTLLMTDYGSQLCYGGGRLHRLVCKALGRQLPSFVRNQPMVCPSVFTNGIALCLRRSIPGGLALQTNWNGTGQFYFLDDSGLEHWIPNHSVNFDTELRGSIYVVSGEVMHWELPMLRDPELRLRIRETNSSTGSVSTHDFRIKNPAL